MELLRENLTYLEFESKSLIDYIPEQTYDLITCVHGLHYPGDKLKVIEVNCSALSSSGLFVANLDLNNIIIEGVKIEDCDKRINSFLKIQINTDPVKKTSYR